jgi:hypothetical protein
MPDYAMGNALRSRLDQLPRRPVRITKRNPPLDEAIQDAPAGKRALSEALVPTNNAERF